MFERIFDEERRAEKGGGTSCVCEKFGAGELLPIESNTRWNCRRCGLLRNERFVEPGHFPHLPTEERRRRCARCGRSRTGSQRWHWLGPVRKRCGCRGRCVGNRRRLTGMELSCGPIWKTRLTKFLLQRAKTLLELLVF